MQFTNMLFCTRLLVFGVPGFVLLKLCYLYLDMLIFSTFAIFIPQPLWHLIQDWKQGQISQYIKPNDIFGALVETCIAVPLGIAVSHNPMTPLIKLQRHILLPWFHLSSMFSLAPSIFSSDLRNVVLWFSGTWLGFFFFLWNAIRALTTSGNSTEIFPFLVILPLRENNNCH